MGSGINIVNGDVSITVNAEMDITKVQEVVDNILTNVGDYTYTSASSDIAAVTFTNLTGTQSLTVTQAGSYDFRNLTSATNVVLGDSFKSTIGIVHFGALTTVNSFKTGSSANSIVFSKATELHLTSLGRYATTSSNVFTLEVDEGGVIDLTALDDVDSDGDQADIYLSIKGPASFTTSKFEDGALTFEDVKTVEVNGFNGTITTNDGVESFTADSLVDAYTVGSDIETLNVTGKVDPDSTTDQSGPAISSSSNNLISATVAGNVASVSFTDASNLESVTVSADVAGSITITGNGDLTSVTLTDSKARGVDVSNNTDLTSLTVDTTIQAGRGATAAATALLKKDGSIVVSNNTDLASLTITSTDAKTLTITGNSNLATISASDLATIGATTTTGPTVNVYGNNFIASKSEDKENTATTKTGTGEVNDLGSFTTSSGMETLKTYLTAVAANTKASAQVYFDTVESYVGEDGVEDGTDATYSSTTTRDNTTANAEQKILVLVANTADTGDAAITSKRSYQITNAVTKLGVVVNGVSILGTNGVSTTNSATLVANNSQTINQLINETSLAQADVAGVSISATANAAPVAYVEIGLNDSNAENSATAASSAWVFGVSDSFTISIDGYSATVTYTHYSAAGGATATDLAEAFENQWKAKYGAIGTVASESAVRWTLGSDTTNNSSISTGGATNNTRIKFTAKDEGTGSIDDAITVTFTAGGTTATHSNVGFVVGNANNMTKSSGDNKAQGTAVVLTIEADTAGDLLGEIGVPLDAASVAAGGITVFNTGGAVSELNSTYNPNITASNVTTATNLYPNESRRNDVVVGDEANAAQTSNAVEFSRIGWL